jgi:hypothetical protein
MERSFVLAVLLVSVLALLGGCTLMESTCPGGCVGSDPAGFKLSCSPNDLVSVVATGPCADPDAPVSWYTGTASEWYVEVPAATVGTCHIVLTFATGFTYSQDVTFDVVPRDSCGCPSYVAPTSGPFTVSNPADTCVGLTDAGAGE